MTTFAQEVDELFYILNKNIKYILTPEQMKLLEDRQTETKISLLNLVSERIIGANGKISGYMRPQGYPTYDLTQSYWNDLRKEQRTVLYEGTKEQNGTPKQ